jgi:hypothetical protein
MENNSCSKCGKIINKKGPLSIHERACNGESKSYTFSSKDVSKVLLDGSLECLGCNRIFKTKNSLSSHYWLNHSESGKEHLKKVLETVESCHQSKIGKPSWNRGLTKETDDRIKKSADKVALKLKNGELKPSGKGRKLSPEQKERLSHARSLILATKGSGGYSSIGWYKYKRLDGEICSLRGTWEVRVAEWLDRNSVTWTKDVLLKYKKDDIKRTYVPDFYIPSANVVLEVKGFFSDKDKEKMILVKDQHKHINFVMLFEAEIKDLNSSLKFLLD